ncbi:hypothetical protein [Fictibacillus macauensis]|nr:hypothetical protein [Fictibacillus macauensis]
MNQFELAQLTNEQQHVLNEVEKEMGIVLIAWEQQAVENDHTRNEKR